MRWGIRGVAAFGRILISLIFIILGIAAIFNWDLAETELAGALTNWEMHSTGIDKVNSVVSTMSSTTSILVVIGIILQVIGGLSLFFGVSVRIGALLLLIYLIPTTVIYHHFWFFEGSALATSLVLFLKNLSIIGGLFVILALGKGRTVFCKREPQRRDVIDDSDQAE